MDGDHSSLFGRGGASLLSFCEKKRKQKRDRIPLAEAWTRQGRKRSEGFLGRRFLPSDKRELHRVRRRERREGPASINKERYAFGRPTSSYYQKETIARYRGGERKKKAKSVWQRKERPKRGGGPCSSATEEKHAVEEPGEKSGRTSCAA